MRLSRRILLLVAALLLIALPAWAEQEGNLLINGSFEMLDGDGLPSGWYTDGWVYDPAVSAYRVTEEAHTGSLAAVVENITANDARFAQNVPVEPDSLYRLSGWIRTDHIADSGRGANISVGGVFAFSESIFDSMGDWMHVEMYGRTGPEQQSLTVFARVGGYSGLSVGSAAFDDIVLEKVDALPEGMIATPWYTEQTTVPVEDAGVESEAGAPFWPWLLVLSGLYGAGAFLACRWTSAKLTGDLRGRADGRHVGLLLPVGMAAAAALRILIAMKVTGYPVDVNCFTAWGATMLNAGPANFYTASGFCDYPPGYLYVLGLNEGVHRLFGGMIPAAFVHKIIPMTCDLLAALLIFRIAEENGASRKQASLLALLTAFNPAVILNSAAWCQVDSVLCFLLMLVAWLAIRRKWSAVLPVYVVAVLVKPQALMMGFLGLAAIVVEMLRELPQKTTVDGRRKISFPKTWISLGWGLLWSLLAAVVLILPFAVGMGGLSWLFELYGRTLSSYPYATVNTANLYYLFGANWHSIMYQAGKGVVAIFMLLSAAWCVVTFMRRRDKALTLLEPAITLLAIAGVVLMVLGVVPILAGDQEAYILTLGNPWDVYYTEGAYVREFIPGVEGAFALQISPVLLMILGWVLLAAASAMVWLLQRRVEQGLQERVHTGLIEPAIMLLFTLVFAFMLVLDATWGAVGTVAMALAFAVVLPIFIRSRELKMLPLCGAVLFILLYVFGVKMHERYLFPALFLLGMAYALRRDGRLLWLMAGLSCTVFINEGIILDNALRLGDALGHLNEDTRWLADVLSLMNTGLAIWSVWLCHTIAAEGQPLKLKEAPPAPLLPVETFEEDPCTPLNYRDSHRVKWGRIDAILICAVTLLYAVVTFSTLGSDKAPQNAWSSTNAQEQIVIDLGQQQEDFVMLYYAQVSYRDFTVETSDDGVTWSADRLYWAEMAEGQCFRWKYLTPHYLSGGKRVYNGASNLNGVTHMSGRYVRLTPQRQYKYDETYYPADMQAQEPLILNEIIFRNAAGERIDAAVVSVLNADETSPYYSDPAALFDEQDTLEGEPSWWNSTYFDEIYHARTAYEHATGQDAYEWTHPPLGKVIMSWFVALFGMTPFGWRFAGALCGVMMLPAMYLLTKQLTKKTSLAFAAMLFMAVDCMHFTQTRIATIDSFPVLFIILSYFFMLRFIQRDIVVTPLKKLLPDLALSGFFMGCGMASKWIGVYAGLGLAVLYFWACIRAIRLGIDAARLNRSGQVFTPQQQETLNLRDTSAMKQVVQLCLWCLLFFVAVPVAIYLASYIVHYQAREVDGILGWLKLVLDTQVNMLNYHGTPGMGMDHPYHSPWYEWPTMQTPMYYASPAFTPNGWRYAIYCFGNPVVWYLGLAGAAYAAYCWVRSHRYGLKDRDGVWHLYAPSWDMTYAFVLIGLGAQLLPWVLVPRGTYIYHYFASVPFLILGAVLLLDRACTRWKTWGPRILLIAMALAAVMFVVLFPYASGMLSPVWWMDIIRNYPWTGAYLAAHDNALVEAISTLMEAIPLMPNVW